MSPTEIRNVDQVHSYLAALETGITGAELAAFFTEDAQQIEWPNRLNVGSPGTELEFAL